MDLHTLLACQILVARIVILTLKSAKTAENLIADSYGIRKTPFQRGVTSDHQSRWHAASIFRLQYLVDIFPVLVDLYVRANLAEEVV